MGGALVARTLAAPETALGLDAQGWTALLTAARAEQLLGTLAHRLDGLALPTAAVPILADARDLALQQRRAALWEAEMARRALAPLGVPVVLLKGAAYAAAGLLAGQGRSIGDLDLLVPRAALADVEAALLNHGWEWVKPDAYDHAYYRRWMHELPPLIHRERDRLIDVHHTILPLTARPTPDAAALIADSVALENGLRVLSPADMIVHAAAHLFADGDLSGGLRNLWDIRCLIAEFGDERLTEHARRHELEPALARAVRLVDTVFGEAPARAADRSYVHRLLARDGWGRATRPATRLAFYMRSHWLRMPPAMLARHLWTKWRRSSSSPG